MPCISGNFNPLIGPVVQVAIVDMRTVLGTFDGTTSPSDLVMFNALIDTGASSTCISKKVVNQTGLVPTGRAPISSVTGMMTVDQFTFGVGFVFPKQKQPSGEVAVDLSIHAVQGCLFYNSSSAFDILLGRDIICRGTFAMSFDGHFVLGI